MNVILSEVVNQLLLAVAEEMGIALKKTAFSPNIKERADCSTAIFDPRGQVVVQAAHIPIHLSSMIGLVERAAALVGRGELGAGDMVLGNDPFTCGGSHLNDIAVAMPVFTSGELVGFVANIAHHSDVGGRVAGSEVGDNTEIFQDGIRLPVLTVVRSGAVDLQVMELLLINTRTPGERQGDFNAQFAANALGARKLAELYARVGGAAYRDAVEALLASTEARTRAAIRALPRGTYRADGLLDDDGVHPGALPLVVRVDIRDGDVVFDFSGTSAQVATSINATPISVMAGIYYVMRAILDPSLPTNAGFYRPFQAEIPRGTLLNAVPPASVAVRFRSVQTAVDLVCKALAEAVPDRVVAGSRGWWGVIISGQDGGAAESFVDYEAHVGGGGATSSNDGWDATWSHCSNSSNLPIEVLEAEYPLRVVRYALRPDSGGAGRFRGGLGCIREIEATRGPVVFSIRGDGYRVAPHGLLGGRRGATGAVYRRTGTRRRRLPATVVNGVLAPGEVLEILSPGGGGFGPASARDPRLTAADVAAEKITAAYAKRAYGASAPLGPVAAKESGTRTARKRRRSRA